MPPTGRNIHALDPYRMPSPAAMERGAAIAEAILAQHQKSAAAQGGEGAQGQWPETVAVNLWGLDAIKTKVRGRGAERKGVCRDVDRGGASNIWGSERCQNCRVPRVSMKEVKHQGQLLECPCPSLQVLYTSPYSPRGGSIE
jgi:hypothetical protein